MLQFVNSNICIIISISWKLVQISVKSSGSFSHVEFCNIPWCKQLPTLDLFPINKVFTGSCSSSKQHNMRSHLLALSNKTMSDYMRYDGETVETKQPRTIRTRLWPFLDIWCKLLKKSGEKMIAVVQVRANFFLWMVIFAAVLIGRCTLCPRCRNAESGHTPIIRCLEESPCCGLDPVLNGALERWRWSFGRLYGDGHRFSLLLHCT